MDDQKRHLEEAVAALYRAISFTDGRGPDWDALRRLMHPQAHFGPAGAAFSYPTVEEFVERAAKGMASLQSFDEIGLAQRVEQFGRIAHVFTSYRTIVNGGGVSERGINSMQFVRDGDSWRCLSMIWDVESASLALPADMQSGG
ncbi:MAG TPA: nuclear transport factor 2 family protein [Candidatus Binatia bacterium]|nr:nuclear transport factor 2 family protein [Candidatus Binatia bacterium]